MNYRTKLIISVIFAAFVLFILPCVPEPLLPDSHGGWNCYRDFRFFSHDVNQVICDGKVYEYWRVSG